MPKKKITTWGEALAEAQRVGTPPVAETLEEMAPIAAEYGLLAEDFYNNQYTGYREALEKLKSGDITGYLTYFWKSTPKDNESLQRIIEGKGLDYYKLVAQLGVQIEILYTKALAFNWLKQNAKEIDENSIEFAKLKGIEVNFIDNGSTLTRETIAHNLEEARRLENLLFNEYYFFTHSPTRLNFILPNDIPEYVKFILNLPNEKTGLARRHESSHLGTSPLLDMATHYALAQSFNATTKRASWERQEQGQFITERGWPVSIKDGKVNIVYFLGEREFEDDVYPQAYGGVQSEEILKRWGLLHSFLHAGLCIAIAENYGNKTELNEKDLLFISGLEAAVKKSNVKKSKAIEQIRTALKDLGTLSAAIRSTDKSMETSRFPLFIIQPIVTKKNGKATNIAASVEAGHWAQKLFGYEAPKFPIPRELFTLPAGIPAALGIWLATNVWRYSNGRRVSLETVLRGAVPDVKPERAEEWSGHTITWAELEPEERTPEAVARMYKCRETLRDQLSRAERVLAAHNINFKIHGSKRTGTSWEEFLLSSTSLSIVGVESRPTLLERTIDAEKPKPTPLTGEMVKAALKAAGMKQGELAKQLGVSAVMVSYWLKPSNDPKAKPIAPEHTDKIRGLLSLKN